MSATITSDNTLPSVSLAFKAWLTECGLTDKALARAASLPGNAVSPYTAGAWRRRGHMPPIDRAEILAARCDDLAKALELERQKLRELLSQSPVSASGRPHSASRTV
jgi:hypothetical protein